MKFPRRHLASPGSLVASLAVATLLASCQSTNSVTSSPGVKDVEFGFRVPRAALSPDSASWEAMSKSGNANLGHDTSTLNTAFSVSIHLPAAIGSDTLQVLLWRAGMLTARNAFRIDAGGKINQLPSNGRDTMATEILDKLESLHSSSPTAYPLGHDSGVAKTMAVLLVQGDSLFTNWTSKFPVGIDTARVRREALVYAASLGQPLSSLAATWTLGLSLDQARTAMLALIPKYLPASDTETLFPVPPVQVATPVSIANAVYSDSTPVSVHGKFLAKKRLFPPSFLVRQAGTEVKNHFEFVQQASPTGTSTSWDLAADGKVTLRAYGDVAAGSYTLVVWMEDGSYGDSSKVDFQVLPKSDKQGPLLERVSPSVDTSLAFGDSILAISVKATDSSGVKSVMQGSRLLARTGSVFQIVDTIPGTGTWTDLALVATDMLDNASTIHLRILRASASTSKPSATPLQPASRTGDTIASIQALRHIVWRITDPVGVVSSSVQIDGDPATKIDDSTWAADVAIPPTGTATSVLVQALNKNGNGVVDSVAIVRRKDTKPPVVASILGTRIVTFDSVSAKVAWKVADDLKVDSIWINGVPQALRADSTYVFTIASLALDTNRVRIRVRDDAGNFASDSQTITRLPNTTPPTLKRLTGTGDMTLAYGTADSVQIRWIAYGNEQIDSVAINGHKAKNSRDTFYLNVAMVPGTIPVVAKAWNLSGLSASDSITISVKLRDKDGNYYGIRNMPDHRVWMTQNLKTLPGQGSSTCALSNCDEYGATYTWSQAMGLDASYDATSAGFGAASVAQGICPAGWHVPLRSEWNALFTSTMAPSTTDSSGALRSDSGWSEPQCLLAVAREQIASPIINPNTPILIPAKCPVFGTNGTNKYDRFLKPGQGTVATGTWSKYWTAQDGATTTAVNEFFSGTSVTAPVTTKTTPSSVRCILNQSPIIRIPIIIRPIISP